ncbi:uncharacterized protein B0I36DRAFT_29386 [Microdochium trichocladiopsis]|uniref:Uncharacterized protein n=1 Tax=Microdochium trichocladiopsis TaxID=1682393 RepID=A0A9P8XWE3_9PEZI|nr:uncharacterized protein B0I36DRAFT_29386 [Microdochium trichocladiopsis]KAH7021141.1 hypothetical protein B0I36DRAFT_29386 [Microdochium trichocladiopsis]
MPRLSDSVPLLSLDDAKFLGPGTKLIQRDRPGGGHCSATMCAFLPRLFHLIHHCFHSPDLSKTAAPCVTKNLMMSAEHLIHCPNRPVTRRSRGISRALLSPPPPIANVVPSLDFCSFFLLSYKYKCRLQFLNTPAAKMRKRRQASGQSPYLEPGKNPSCILDDAPFPPSFRYLS